MATSHFSTLGKVLYAILFVAVLPVFLILWAKMTEHSVPLHAIGSMPAGAAIVAVGAAIMISGMLALIFYGKGLPMNPYPPIKFVTRGIYSITAHPIYAGFCLACIGAAIAAKSSSGLWLISPIVILSCVALVQGFEKDDLRKRFGNASAKPFLHLPADEDAAAGLADRVSIYILVALPWIILYEAVAVIGIPADATVAYLPFEKRLPVFEVTEYFYASTYLFVLLLPLVAKTKRELRDLAISGLLGTGIIMLFFLTVPLIAPPREFVAHGLAGRLLIYERSLDTPAAAFPSFHVFWAFLAARGYSTRLRSLKMVWFGFAVLISLSCIATGMHAIVDVLAGFAIFVVVRFRRSVWEEMRRLTESVANSWREWRLGPVRIINHGIYAGVSAFVGILVFSTLAGPHYIVGALVIASLSVIGAALWAQFVEGSPSLLRPYGWYGGLLGAILGVLLMILFRADLWLMLGASAVAAPLIQSLGRLRCLVQGCCHGREAPAAIGIRYVHSRSRVSRLTSLGGVPVHPTPLYSILANLAIAIILGRLWLVHAPISLIVGIYLILSGLARFVEENYRGEPQTPVRAKLRIYQWLAILSALAGVFITTISHSPAAPGLQFNALSIRAALGFGCCAWFALGVDFPESTRRFAKLA